MDDREEVLSDFIGDWGTLDVVMNAYFRADLEKLHKILAEIEDRQHLDPDVKPKDAKPPEKQPSEGQRLILI